LDMPRKASIMTFFEHQDRARTNTKTLVTLYLASVAGIVLAVYGATVITAGLLQLNQGQTYSGRRYRSISRVTRSYSPSSNASTMSPTASGVHEVKPFAPWQPTLLFWSATPTLLLIGGASWFKLQTLKQGGPVIAQNLGGRLLLPEVASELEQQLLNVVDELAIAANIPAPAVYVLDAESSINAFAAGYSTRDAVVGVTRGCLERLNRDQLQGVIGHEFSHILNGDMRLNMQLVGALHGILLIYIVGRIVVDWRSDRESYAWLFLGLSLMAIGSIGNVFGRIIQSAVSRQREFLADASAVQFTRNPEGIASALELIRGHADHSTVNAPYATEMSHLFFGNALKASWLEGDLFATHPPVQHRIQRLNAVGRRTAYRDASQPMRSVVQPAAAETSVALTEGLTEGLAEGLALGFAAASSAIAHSHNTSSPTQFPAWVSQLPPLVQAALQDEAGATAIAYCLLLNRDRAYEQQTVWLQQALPSSMAARVLELHSKIASLPAKRQLQLLTAARPMLVQTTTEQQQQRLKLAQGLAKADGGWSVREFVVYLGLRRYAQQSQQATPSATVTFTTINPVWAECLLVLSAIAQAGSPQPEAVAYAFRTGLYELPGVSGRDLPTQPPACDFRQLSQSLDRLSGGSTPLRQAIVKACTAIVLLPKTIHPSQSDLLWAIATYLDCPLPACLMVRG
jgi:Zn-dependent protease with chaperone function